MRLDGVRMEALSPRTHAGLSSNRITALCAARDGSLWIGTVDRQVFRFRRGLAASRPAQPVGPRARAGPAPGEHVAGERDRASSLAPPGPKTSPEVPMRSPVSTVPRLVAAGAAVLVLSLAAFVTFGDGGPPAAWSAELRSPAYGACIAEGVVAFCTQDEVLHVVALETGAERWSCSGRRAYQRPAVAGGRVFVTTLDDTVVAFDLGSGEELWTAERLDWIDALVPVRDGLLVARGAGFQVLDPETGEEAWAHLAQAEDGAWLSTESIAVADGVAYVGYSIRANVELSIGDRSIVEGGVYAVDLESGDVLWTGAVQDRVSAPPAVADDTVLVATRSGLSDAVLALDRSDGSLRWKVNGVNGAPRIVAGTACFEGVDGETKRVGNVPVIEETWFYEGVDLATGAESWRRAFRGNGGSSAVAGDLILFARGGRVDALRAATGGLAWSLSLDAAADDEASAQVECAAGWLVVLGPTNRVAAYRLAPDAG